MQTVDTKVFKPLFMLEDSIRLISEEANPLHPSKKRKIVCLNMLAPLVDKQIIIKISDFHQVVPLLVHCSRMMPRPPFRLKPI